MEFSEAAELLKVRNPVSVDELGERLAAHHADNPQREMMARRAVAMIREGLGHLAGLGHQFHLVEAKPEDASALRFPQMLYKASNERVTAQTVNSQDEFDAATADGFVTAPSGLGGTTTGGGLSGTTGSGEGESVRGGWSQEGTGGPASEGDQDHTNGSAQQQ